ncbi:MAG: hypothetical protein QXO86_06890 [Nitrososphaerota archaeon]
MPTVSSVLAKHGVKSGATLEWDVSRLKIAVYDVVFGAAENYVSGGVSVSFPGFSEVIGAFRLSGLNGYHVIYSGGKIVIYGQEPTNATTGVIALKELPNASTVTNSASLRFLVIGR